LSPSSTIAACYLLQYDRPVWRTIKGGSGRYVETMTAAFRDQPRLGCAVTSIERTPQAVIVNDGQGYSQRYDDAVIATHSEPGTPDIGLSFAWSISGKIMPGRS
jgi:hypothetical protein